MFEEPVIEKPKKVKKPMSDERKEALREQLRKAREKKKANKEAKLKKASDSKPSKEAIEDKPIIEDKPFIEIKPLNETQAKQSMKTIHEEEEHEVIDATELVANLKAEIAELKKGKTTSNDMEEIRALKEEMKDIRDAAKLYKEQKKKIKEQPKPKVVKEQVKPTQVKLETPKIRHSTYKKSIWAGLL